jgi:hypothetical protein
MAVTTTADTAIVTIGEVLRLRTKTPLRGLEISWCAALDARLTKMG